MNRNDILTEPSKCASAVYVISDVIGGGSWELGWSEGSIDASVDKLIDAVIRSVKNRL